MEVGSMTAFNLEINSKIKIYPGGDHDKYY